MDKILKINNLVRTRIDKKYFEKVAKISLELCDYKGKIEISLVFTGEEEIRLLNQRYRHKNKPTDVLSFSYQINNGEIIICYPIAVKQAKENKNSVKNELTRLLIHGILHLVGYNHYYIDDRLKMEILEKEILGNLK